MTENTFRLSLDSPLQGCWGNIVCLETDKLALGNRVLEDDTYALDLRTFCEEIIADRLKELMSLDDESSLSYECITQLANDIAVCRRVLTVMNEFRTVDNKRIHYSNGEKSYDL